MPGLGQRKRQESADGKQRNQPVRDTAKQDQEHRAQRRQDIDPLRVHKPPAARGKAMGKIPVLSDGAAESRKIRKGGVRRECEYEQNGADGNVVENPFPRHGGGELRKHALVSCFSGVGRADVVGTNQKGDSRQQHDEDGDDGRQSALR